ncbi:MAG: hypothetical protein HY543_06180 [Deltaproteobacteria bacterium]|nr:hypothetical protein [Deltaproteobacteria bacterium]
MEIQDLWRNRIALVGVILFAQPIVLSLLAPGRLFVPGPLAYLSYGAMYLFCVIGILVHFRLLREEEWARKAAIAVQGLATFVYIAFMVNFVMENQATFFLNRRLAIVNFLLTQTFLLWTVSLSVRWLRMLPRRSEQELQDWIQQNTFVTAIAFSLYLLAFSLNHLHEAYRLGFWKVSARNVVMMKIGIHGTQFYGFFGWKVWHLALFVNSLLLLGSLLFFLVRYRGKRAILLSSLSMCGLFLLAGLLFLVKFLMMKSGWSLFIFVGIWSFIGLLSLMCYWLYDAFVYSFDPASYARRFGPPAPDDPS